MAKRFSLHPTHHTPSTDDFELYVQSDPHLGRSFRAMRVWQMHRGKWVQDGDSDLWSSDSWEPQRFG